jgi:hypothetical protein
MDKALAEDSVAIASWLKKKGFMAAYNLFEADWSHMNERGHKFIEQAKRQQAGSQSRRPAPSSSHGQEQGEMGTQGVDWPQELGW